MFIHFVGLLAAQLKPAAEYNKFLRQQWALLTHRDPTIRVGYRQFLDGVIKYKYVDKKISRDDFCRESDDVDEQ